MASDETYPLSVVPASEIAEPQPAYLPLEELVYPESDGQPMADARAAAEAEARRQADAARRQAEATVAVEAAARRAAETRAETLSAELARLRGELPRRDPG